VPQNPEAWLLTAARHSLIDVIRHHQVVLESEPTLQFLWVSSTEAAVSTTFQDERLFVCAHPAIDPAMHAPLCCRQYWAWMQHALPKPFLSHRGSACSARRQKSAVVASSLKFPKNTAIQSIHAERARTGFTNCAAIECD
jgi:RNA polymerase sigma-70 factor (ECF subfamily)